MKELSIGDKVYFVLRKDKHGQCPCCKLNQTYFEWKVVEDVVSDKDRHVYWFEIWHLSEHIEDFKYHHIFTTQESAQKYAAAKCREYIKSLKSRLKEYVDVLKGMS